MSDPGKTVGSGINIELGAKAEAKIEAKVPEKSVGRLVDALTDIIRPFSEPWGLRADQIRLQREDVAIEIAKRVRRRLQIENAPVHAVPNKILVPLIEYASLEEPDDEFMINAWSNLLHASATTDQVQPRFLSILREMTGSQARLLREVCASQPVDGFTHLHLLQNGIDEARAEACYNYLFNQRWTEEEKYLDKEGRVDFDAIIRAIEDVFHISGCALVNITISCGEDTYGTSLGEYPLNETRYVPDFEVLKSIGIVEHIFKQCSILDTVEIAYEAYLLTDIGRRFYASCTALDSQGQPIE